MTVSHKRPRSELRGLDESPDQQQQHQLLQRTHRGLTSESSRNPILCSPIYTDIHIVTFFYTIDTKRYDNNDSAKETIRSSIKQLEQRSNTLLAQNMIHCGGLRRLTGIHVVSDARSNVMAPEFFSFRWRRDRIDMSPVSRNLTRHQLDLGIAGFSAWPPDEISTEGLSIH